MTELATDRVNAETTMRDLLLEYPGAQRALFAKYHIGGCQSCGFQPEETLGQVCARNEDLPVSEVLDHIRESHDADARLSIEPLELRETLEKGEEDVPRLIDIRTREEFDAVKIPGAEFFTQEGLNEIMSTWDKETSIVICDHSGDRGIDAAAFLLGHGFARARCLRGGIDAYSREADPSLPRYRIEFE